jgi:hypothetical protein
MRLIDGFSLTALEGSRPADTLTVWAWRGSSLVVPEPLQIINWSAQDDAGDAVKIGQKMSFTIADPDGSLGAWRFDDPLGVGGTKLQVVYRVGGAGAVNFAWLRVVANEPDEVIDWRPIDEYGHDLPDGMLGPHRRSRPILQGVVKLEAVDLTINVDRDKLENPESPGEDATILSEFQRLTAEYFPTVIDDGVTDRPVSRQLVLDRERLEAAQDLLSRISASYRMGGDGECHVYPRTAPPVWRTEPGNCLVSVSRKQSLGGLYNRWVVQGKDSGDGNPITGSATITTGPLHYGGPHGKAQFFYSSEMIETVGQANAYAEELKTKAMASLAVELTVITSPRPELQAGDRIEVGYPVAAGHVAYFLGQITSAGRQGNPLPGPTTLTVSCSYSDVITSLKRTEWAQFLTAGTPELTWDRMPGTWGTFPDIEWDDLP